MIVPLRRFRSVVLIGCATAVSAACQPQAVSNADGGVQLTGGTPVELGRYLVIVSGCNDCLAWAYQGVPRIGRQMLYRQEALPKTVCDIAWKAQLRLTTRFRRLVARGKAKPKVATAIARELTGFIWAIAREVPAPPA